MLEDLLIDFSSPVPIYAQISMHVQECVEAGILPPGSALPPIRSLATALGVNQNTVLQAYDRLQAIGLVSKRRGTGTVIRAKSGRSPRKRPERIENFKSGLDSLISRAFAGGSGPDEIMEVLGARLGELARGMTEEVEKRNK